MILSWFIFVRPCVRYLRVAIDLFREIGVPLALEKIKGPSQVLKYLGIVIDTVKMEVRLPADKLEKMAYLLAKWMITQHGTKVAA